MNLIQQKDARIAELEQKLAEFSTKGTAEDFAKRVGEGLMIILANIPINSWPELALIAFRHEASKTPTAAQTYLEFNGLD